MSTDSGSSSVDCVPLRRSSYDASSSDHRPYRGGSRGVGAGGVRHKNDERRGGRGGRGGRVSPALSTSSLQRRDRYGTGRASKAASRM